MEVDGGQHATTEVARDAARTTLLEKQGLHVLRFWNNEILDNLEGCVHRIVEVATSLRQDCEAQASQSSLSPETGNGSG